MRKGKPVYSVMGTSLSLNKKGKPGVHSIKIGMKGEFFWIGLTVFQNPGKGFGNENEV